VLGLNNSDYAVKNGVEAMTGILVTQDFVQGSAAQREKKYNGDM